MWPDGYGRILLDGVDSTNAEALRRAGDLAGPAWICAHRQSAGRGRRGRAWAMPEGNFAASLALRTAEPPERRALRSFVAALALFDAVAEAVGSDRGLALKWPNDVLLNGGKMAGILLEGQGEVLVIGLGVNLVAVPDAAALETGAVAAVSILGETGVRVGAEDFLDRLAAAYAPWETRLVTYGFEPVRQAWLARAARLGERIVARTARETHEGTFETVDASGALVLKTAKGRESIAAADIFFG
nr:biotin--[acetyl-CoA-carboxylase] ligase [Thetidibacter halocola]